VERGCTAKAIRSWRPAALTLGPQSFLDSVHKDRQQTSESSTKVSAAPGGVGRISSDVLADFVERRLHYVQLETHG
jgi:hypothetical protein